MEAVMERSPLLQICLIRGILVVIPVFSGLNSLQSSFECSYDGPGIGAVLKPNL